MAAIALVAGLLVTSITSAPPAGADEPAQYFDGSIRYSNVLNCPSVIQGFPYSEFGVGVYTGEYLDPDGTFPMVGDTTYIHIVAYGLGNPCAGQRVFPAIDLPAGITLANPGNPDSNLYCANSLTPDPAPCHSSVDLTSSAPYGGDYAIYSGDTNNARTWALPAGRYWEWVIAVKGTQTVTSAQIQAHVKVLDGNGSPVLRPTSNGYIFGAAPQPAVFYDTPSTVASPTMPGPGGVGTSPTTYGLWSQGTVFTNGAPGVVHLDFGTTATNLQPRPASGVPVNNTGTSWNIWTDWAEPGFGALQPGATYRWRLRFVPQGGGPATVGALQTFTVPTSETCQGQPVNVSLALGEVPTTGDDVILGTAGNDGINGLGGNDVVCAGGGSDNVNGGAGNDSINGGAGRDNLIGEEGSDTIIGDVGVDTASYAGNPNPVTVNLAQTTAQDTLGAGLDTITGVENLTGTGGADTLVGNGSPNRLDGGAGGDTLTGGAGVDTVSYAGTTNRVVVSLSNTAAQNTQGSGLDRITQVENLVGTAKGDQLTGNAQVNFLDGGAGTDRCDGKAARDTQVRCETRISIP